MSEPSPRLWLKLSISDGAPIADNSKAATKACPVIVNQRFSAKTQSRTAFNPTVFRIHCTAATKHRITRTFKDRLAVKSSISFLWCNSNTTISLISSSVRRQALRHRNIGIHWTIWCHSTPLSSISSIVETAVVVLIAWSATRCFRHSATTRRTWATPDSVRAWTLRPTRAT